MFSSLSLSEYDKRFEDFIRKSLPAAALTEDTGQEFTYNVPSEDPKALHAFFVQLESKLDQFNVSSYGVSETKLEEVSRFFLLVEHYLMPKVRFSCPVEHFCELFRSS